MVVRSRCCRDPCSVFGSVLFVRFDRTTRSDIDRMDRRNCRHEATAALRAAKAGTGGDFGERAFFDEGAVYAEGGLRCMTAHAVRAGFYLAPIASDTAGDVGAVHHDISSEACGISKSGLWF